MSEWIKVTDRFPENHQYILAYDNFEKDISIMQFNITNDKRRKTQKWYFDHSDDWCETDNITHWMPLPQQPKEAVN